MDTFFGNFLKNLRKHKNATLHQVAVGTNIDATILSKIERGKRLPTDEQIERLAHYFDVSCDVLLSQTIAEKIIKTYGINEATKTAIQLVKEQFEEYRV